MTELGLKPINFIIDERRLNYYNKITNPEFKGSSLLLEYIRIQEASPKKFGYIKEILRIKADITPFKGDTLAQKQRNWQKRTMHEFVHTSQLSSALNLRKILSTKDNLTKDFSHFSGGYLAFL